METTKNKKTLFTILIIFSCIVFINYLMALFSRGSSIVAVNMHTGTVFLLLLLWHGTGTALFIAKKSAGLFMLLSEFLIIGSFLLIKTIFWIIGGEYISIIMFIILLGFFSAAAWGLYSKEIRNIFPSSNNNFKRNLFLSIGSFIFFIFTLLWVLDSQLLGTMLTDLFNVYY